MKVFTCVLAFVATVHGELLSHLVAPQTIHSETASLPHATLPTAPLKILKVIHEAAANVVNIAAPAAAEIIKVIHESHHGAPAPVSPPNIVKVIHQSAPVSVAAVDSGKVLRVIHEYAPRHYAPAPEAQSTRILKLIKQQTVTPHPVSTAQNVRVIKVFRQVGGGGGSISSSSASHGVGHAYASSYGHRNAHATPGSAVKIVKVLQKPSHLPTW